MVCDYNAKMGTGSVLRNDGGTTIGAFDPIRLRVIQGMP